MPTSSMPPFRPAEIPAAAWSRPIGQPLDNPARPRAVQQPTFDDGYWQGLPLGGLGAGSLGRTYRGDFARWHLQPGSHHYRPLPACMFSVFIARGEQRLAQALWTEHPADDLLPDWRWDYPRSAGTYYALFPRAWFVYDAFPIRLWSEQFSPILPHNYRETSYPLAIFLWTAHNPTPDPASVSILFTWQNLVGYWTEAGPPPDIANEVCQETLAAGLMRGVVLGRGDRPVSEAWDGSFAIAALETPGVAVTYHSRFSLHHSNSLWDDFAAAGRLANLDDRRPAAPGEAIGAAVCVNFDLPPGASRTVPLILAWDFPLMQFGQGTRWHRRYTRFFGRSGRNAWAIAREGLLRHHDWRAEIVGWQAPILADPDRPDWYKTALFNELYYLVDGGAAWEAGSPDPAIAAETPPANVGRFALLECFDYPFYETLDVRFYSSFPLLRFWPELEKGVMRCFAESVAEEDLTLRRIVSNGALAPRKLAGALPHDLGMPAEDPWRRANAYDWQDPNVWKDLNSKFILLVYRDALFTGDWTFAADAWPAVQQALAYLRAMDRDGDGLPENEGLPDQTYDTWPMSGPSAYCSGLWLAALQAAIALAHRLGDRAAVARYQAWLQTAQTSFEQALWNGQYYRFDASPAGQVVMADQLAGLWYTLLTDLPPVVPLDQARSALETVVALNVRGFAGGQMGAVNGMFLDGRVDESSEHSQEVWAGTTYGLAALLGHLGLWEEAWQIAWGVYRTTYETHGLWFRTPEAWDRAGHFRASLYLRPLAIWALEVALAHR